MIFANETVFVTDGASSIGSRLVESLVDKGATVRVADDFSFGTRRNLSSVIDEIDVLDGEFKLKSVAERATEGIDRLFTSPRIMGVAGTS